MSPKTKKPTSPESKSDALSTDEAPRGRWRLVRLTLMWLLVAVIGFAAAGMIYQELGARNDRKTFPPPGELITVDGVTMHIDCRGEGEPTVVLDAGAGGWSIHWFALHDQLAAHVRTCAFDRAGVGWSESRPGPTDGVTLSAHAHALFEVAGLREPVVYVGHSLGANLAQLYAAAHPDHVAGLVLVDPGRPVDMLEDFEGTAEDAAAIESCGWTCGVGSAVARLGLMRLIMGGYESRHFDDATTRRYRAGMTRPESVATIASYLKFLPRTAHQLMDLSSSDYGNVPLVVLYSEKTRRPEGEETDADVADWHQAVLSDMAELAAQSSRGRGPIVVPDATHTSVVLAEDAVAQVLGEIVAVLDEVRAIGSGDSDIEPAGGEPLDSALDSELKELENAEGASSEDAES